MRLPGWTITLAACILAASGREAAAQGAGTQGRSTLAGVYTADQAARGRTVYAGMCQSCHTPASHTGPTFKNSWVGHPLSDLFDFVVERMPKNDPGSLSAEDYADVIAYLLKMNQMPAGKVELPTDTMALRKIRIDTPPAQPAGAPDR
jgi:S-disulfanyl-L-cysteine oxidoreductase SoxD